LTENALDVSLSAISQTPPGRTIWLVAFPLGSMNDPLFDEFDRRLVFVNSNDKLGVLCFRRK
jgi:hypothetical protein